MTTTLIGLAVIVALVLFTIAVYNRLVKLRNQVRNAFAQIDVQLQRRHDLIPNLVETAKSYMKHERETLTQVMQARNGAVAAQEQAAKDPADGGAMRKLSSAENMLTKAMGGFYAVSENYPDLKANQTLQQLMEDLSSTENRVAFARQAFNDNVMGYNIYREQFPNNLMAGFFAFKPAEQLALETPEARQAPKVSFS
ncbi:MAG: LemA family protein [Halomonadaceae bacterium]|nr:MAG: LemA family protein [Halomonadaceae bacterium]